MKIAAVPQFLEKYFVPVAVLCSALAMVWPEGFTWIRPHIALGLGVIMFGMGLTLDFEDFRDILRKWRIVGLGVIMQYVLMPLLAVAVSFACGLPPEAVIGMVVVGRVQVAQPLTWSLIWPRPTSRSR